MAQINWSDPQRADQYETPAEEGCTEPCAVEPADTPAYPETEYQPVDPGLDQGMDAAPADTVPAAPAVTAAPRETVPREDIFTAAADVIGKGAAGPGGIIEDILNGPGEPIRAEKRRGGTTRGIKWR